MCKVEVKTLFFLAKKIPEHKTASSYPDFSDPQQSDPNFRVKFG